jgi:hypothetical protein
MNDALESAFLLRQYYLNKSEISKFNVRILETFERTQKTLRDPDLHKKRVKLLLHEMAQS